MPVRTVILPMWTRDPVRPPSYVRMSDRRWRAIADEVVVEGVTSGMPSVYQSDGTGRVFRRLSESRWVLLGPDEEPDGEVTRAHECHFVDVGEGEWALVHDAYVRLATGGRMRIDDEFDERLHVALTFAARYRMEAFSRMLLAHADHETFRHQGWAYTREVGFTCACSGEEEWRVSLSSVADLLPEARERLIRAFGMRDPDNYRRDVPGEPPVNPRGVSRLNNRQRRRDLLREKRRARKRARALLHRHLTKEQRWDLRASRSFTVTGQDGRRYQITEGSCANVYLLEGGERRFQLCVVFEGHLPVPIHDLMLAQKLMIEGDLRSFLELARATNMRTRYHFAGRVLLDGIPDDDNQRLPDPIDVTNRDVEDPVGWARRLFRQIEEERNADTGTGTDEREAGDGDGRDGRDGPGGGLQALLGQGLGGGGEDREEGLQAV